MSRTTNLILCSAPLLLVGLASLATAQDEITPPLDPLEEGALADEGAPSIYTFEDDSLQLFDRSRRDGEPPIGIDITELFTRFKDNRADAFNVQWRSSPVFL